MKEQFLAALFVMGSPLAAQLVTDQHWSYDAPQLRQSEPFAFATDGNYL